MDDERALRRPPKPWDDIVIGRGAFRTALKRGREAPWSDLKGKCRHE